MSKKLEGKVALVTGGSRGIGAATARALAEAGANVAISYTAAAEKAEAVARELEGLGVGAAAFLNDQADLVSNLHLMDLVIRRFGRLDILVNNAGVVSRGVIGDPEFNTAATTKLYEINLLGVVSLIRAASKLMAESGRIITVGSCVASRPAFAGLADYAATKAAIVGYTKGAARDLAPRNITVNVVQPGPIATEMNPESGAHADALQGATVLNRYGTAEEVAAGIVFLASPEASFITGAVLDIDGGWSL